MNIWLAMRGTRHKQLCGICYNNGTTFPGGFYEGAWCEQCIADHHITPLNNCPFGRDLQLTLDTTYFSPTVAMSEGADQQLPASHFRSIYPTNSTVCVACGCGDNTVGTLDTLVHYTAASLLCPTSAITYLADPSMT